MSPAAMNETLLALENHKGFLDFQSLQRRELGAARAKVYEVRLRFVEQAIEEVNTKINTGRGNL